MTLNTVRFLLLSVCYALCGSFVYGVTWDGSVDDDWNCGGNWAGCSVPGANCDVCFGTTGSGTVNLASCNNVNNMTINSNCAYFFACDGATLNFGNAGQCITVACNGAFSGTHTIAQNICFNNHYAVTNDDANATLLISGCISVTGNRDGTFGGAGTINMSGANWSGGCAGSCINKVGTGVLNISGTNVGALQRDLNVNQGTVSMAASTVNARKLEIASACGASGPSTMIMDNTAFTVTNLSRMAINGNDAALIMRNGSSFTLNNCANFTIAQGNGAEATLCISDSTIWFNGGCGSFGSSAACHVNATAYGTFNNSTLKMDGAWNMAALGDATFHFTDSTVTIGGDFDVAENNGAQGYLEMTNSPLTVSQDLIVGHGSGGQGTMIYDGGACNTTLTVCGKIAIGQSNDSTMIIRGGATVDVNGTCSNTTQKLGDACTDNIAQLHIDGCGTTFCVSTPCNDFTINSANSLVELSCGGLASGSSTWLFRDGDIRGCGTISSDIRLACTGGEFGTGGCAADVLILSGSITNGGTQDLIKNGPGTIRLGGNQIITDSDLDIDLNGGTLDTGGFTQGVNNATIGNLTMAANSVIQLDSNNTGTGSYGAHSVFLAGIDTSAGSISINGWAGSLGGSGSKGRLLSLTLPAGMAAGDNGGLGFTGITWNGGLYTRTEVLTVNIGGNTFYEIIPFGIVPESSTWIGGLFVILVSMWHYRRYRLNRSA